VLIVIASDGEEKLTLAIVQAFFIHSSGIKIGVQSGAFGHWPVMCGKNQK
jgi:hypothetical protein